MSVGNVYAGRHQYDMPSRGLNMIHPHRPVCISVVIVVVVVVVVVVVKQGYRLSVTPNDIKPSQSYGVSPAIWNHIMLPAVGHG